MNKPMDDHVGQSLIITNITNFDEDDELLMPKYGYILAAIALTFIGVFGFVLNLIVIILMVKNKLVNTPLNIILFNLVCSDFSVSVFGNPFTFLSAVHHRWLWGETMCQAYGFFMSLLGISSITTLTVLAFERYMIVCHSFSKYSLSNRGSIYVLVCIWIYSCFLTVPPLVGWGKYVAESANISCSVNWHEKSMNAKTYIIYLFVFGLKIPLILIIFSYANIIRTIKKNTLTKGHVTKAENRVAYMVLIMVLAFLFAWTPYAIISLIAQFSDVSLISPGMSVIPALIAKSSICYNPIIYVGMNTQLKKTFMNMLHIETNAACIDVNSQTYTTMGTSRCISVLVHLTEDRKSKQMRKMMGERYTNDNCGLSVVDHCKKEENNENKQITNDETAVTSV
ncbi:parapinopsin [Aethina tumida]|uniref:parapinopsin n=1 Tax=Aethina tumida TaxID=116153 RepID=UPI00096B3397|nr:parapinopsin [Aethina tumida]XP_049825705.1 parapinopsin [Aethina tumida]